MLVVLAGAAALLVLTALPSAALNDLDFRTSRACPSDRLPRAGFLDTGVRAWDPDCLAWYDIAAGTTAITYAPDQPVTRGQAASFAVRMVEQLDGVSLPRGNVGFRDVTGGPHRDAIRTLASLDPPVIRGFPDGTFREHRPVTRAQFSTIVRGTLDAVADRRSGLSRLAATGQHFPDTRGTTHADSIRRLTAVGIIQGFPDGRFRPDDAITRGQVARMFSRSMGGMVHAGLLARPPADPGPDLSVDLRLTRVASGGVPIAGALGPDGRLYIADRRGLVRPLRSNGYGSAVIDIRSRVSTGSERGLLGIAFSRDARELYLSYTDTAGNSIIEAFRIRGGTIRSNERRTVLTQAQPQGNHNGGNLIVGPDGMLYFGLGDGGGSGDPRGAGQDRSTMLGSMVRIDPTRGSRYAVPSDNPYVGRSGIRPEIWAYGLRNPWRFSFDRANADLWIADVGQNAREEINYVPAGRGAGANFGWNRMEGTRRFAGSEPSNHWPPIYEYQTRGPEGCSVTGGYVYRGDAIPRLRGAYLYADFCNGTVRGLIVRNGEVAEQRSLGIDGGRVVSFAEDRNGELYVFDLTGAIHRIDRR